MTMDGEEEGIESNEPCSRDGSELVKEISNIIESVAQFGDYRKTHKKDCFGLVRRMKLLLPLLEEIRDCDAPISDKGIACLSNLKKALILARKLLKVCNEGSKINLVCVLDFAYSVFCFCGYSNQIFISGCGERGFYDEISQSQ